MCAQIMQMCVVKTCFHHIHTTSTFLTSFVPRYITCLIINVPSWCDKWRNVISSPRLNIGSRLSHHDKTGHLGGWHMLWLMVITAWLYEPFGGCWPGWETCYKSLLIWGTQRKVVYLKIMVYALPHLPKIHGGDILFSFPRIFWQYGLEDRFFMNDSNNIWT